MKKHMDLLYEADGITRKLFSLNFVQTMKHILKHILALVLLMNLTGCIKDTGNYEHKDPKDVAPILVSGIEESYSAISLGETGY
ncbi:hypothetical protein MASR2M69_06620 [Bacteroidota bacterium]